MKKKLQLIFLAAFAMLLTGCYTNVINLSDTEGGGSGGGSGGGGGEDNTELILHDPAQRNIQIFAENQTCSIEFTTQRGWNVYIPDSQAQSWVTVTPSRSDNGGKFTLYIIIDENTYRGERSMILNIYSGNASETIFISQAGHYQDGTQPQPYERDTYTDIVEKITVQNYLNGEAESSIREWHFFTNYESGETNTMECYLLDTDLEIRVEQISFLNYSITEHLVYGQTQPYDIVYRQRGEVLLNHHNFITRQQLQEFNYQFDNNPEPTQKEIVYQYTNYRRVSEWNFCEYLWNNGNMTKQVYASDNVVKFAYGVEKNDKANIDLNTFLLGDMYAAMGLFGKRSSNLITSITDNKGGVSNFDYSFDTQRRVRTVTRRWATNGLHNPIFTIYYAGDNDN